jgi:hypothetical protein
MARMALADVHRFSTADLLALDVVTIAIDRLMARLAP